MNIETGFEDETNDTLVKVAEKKYGGISIIAELLNRFTTLVDN